MNYIQTLASTLVFFRQNLLQSTRYIQMIRFCVIQLEKKILFWYQQDARLICKPRGSPEISVGLPFKILKMELVNLYAEE